MIRIEDRINTINEYFGTDYSVTDVVHDKSHTFPKPSIYQFSEILRFVHRIRDEGFIVNIQDLNPLDRPPEYKIWFNLTEGMIECPFGHISQGTAHGHLECTTLVHCLLYSISEWCKYNKCVKQNIVWHRSRNAKWEGYAQVGDREILIYRIHDLDYFHLEYVDLNKQIYMSDMPESYYIDDVKSDAQSMMYSSIVSIFDDPENYNLKNK